MDSLCQAIHNIILFDRLFFGLFFYMKFKKNKVINPSSSNCFDGLEVVNIIFDKSAPHCDVLFQALEGLVVRKFASRKEIMEEWHNLLSCELEK